jgi:hypothetical protein
MKYCVAYLFVFGVLSFAVGAPTREDDQKEIIGRWDHPKSDTCYIRFYQGGAYRLVTLNEKVEGRYQFLPGGVIEFAIPAPGNHVTTTEIKYKLSDDTLELKFGKETIRYKKCE